MKALTLWQPWASLLIAGFKVHETRSWAPLIPPGWIAIHAAQHEPAWVRQAVEGHARPAWAAAAWRRLSEIGYTAYPELPRGAVVGLVYIDRVTLTGHAAPSDSDDALFGDWTPGRYAWHVDRAYLLTPPVPATGRQKLWTWMPGAGTLDTCTLWPTVPAPATHATPAARAGHVLDFILAEMTGERE